MDNVNINLLQMENFYYYPEDVWTQFPQKKKNIGDDALKSLRETCMGNICETVDHWMKWMSNEGSEDDVQSPFRFLSKFLYMYTDNKQRNE